MYCHLLGEITGTCIESISMLQDMMDEVASQCKFTVVGSTFHQFEPIGATGVLILAESHFSAHTYPEDDKVFVDVFCCSPTFDPEYTGRVILKKFRGSHAKWQIITR